MSNVGATCTQDMLDGWSSVAARARKAVVGPARYGAIAPGDLLQATLESMDHGCVVLSQHLDILGSNERAADILNVPHAMLAVGASFADVIALAAERGDYGPGDPEMHKKRCIASATSGVAHNFDRNQPDGSILSARAEPLPGGGMVITYTDITPLRKLEEDLRESEERFALAIASSKSGIWDWNIAAGTVFLTPRYADILGIAPNEIGSTPDWWAQFIHPDDVEHFHRQIRDHISGGTENFEAEYRVHNARGEIRWIGDRGTALRDTEGRAHRMVGSVDDITDRKEAETTLQTLATTDALTGACNRRKFLEVASGELYRAQRYGSALSLALFDIDHFKRINDTHGHADGDACLVSFVGLVQAAIRQSDTLGRHGGEEFALLMPETDLEPARDLCDRVRMRVEQAPPRAGDKTIPMTVSAGVAVFRPGDTLELMLSRADEALYQAKGAGRNRIIAQAAPAI